MNVEEEVHSLLQQESIANFLPLEETRGTFASNAQGRYYGFKTFSDYFTSRQLLAISTFANCLLDLRKIIYEDVRSRNSSETLSKDYSNAIVLYLSLSLDKGINLWSSLSSWMGDRGAMRETFSQQGIAISWDFAEANPFSNSGGSINLFIQKVCDALIFAPANVMGVVAQLDATESNTLVSSASVITDPPYYGNVSYSDIMDFFYVWQRKILGAIFPDLFRTILIPKKQELVANHYRFGGDKEKAKEAFENGLAKAFRSLFQIQDSKNPSIIFYAFRQTESEDDSEYDDSLVSSTGWETMLEGLINSGFLISGTWPIRTESSGRNVAQGTNALASSIVLVCRPRYQEVGNITRREFLTTLKRELPPALRQLQQGSIAPVDLAQAAIGPGMAVFSRYAAVLEADGTPMRVRTALALINQALDEFLAEQEGEYDSDTRWALAWYEQYGHNEAAYGVAETLSKAKNTSVEGLVEAGFLEARSGKVRLLRRDELDPEWNPQKDKRPTSWEAVQHLIRALDKDGEQAAGFLLRTMDTLGESARDLAYRLYTVCERKSWAQDALGYNMLVVAWPKLKELAARQADSQQGPLL